MLYYVFLSLGAFVFTLIGTRLTILALRKKQALLDLPNARSNHKAPVPRGGGIAVVFTLVIFLLVANANYLLVFGMLLLASISLVDDWIKLSPLTRLFVQVIAVLALVHEVAPALQPDWLPFGIAAAIVALAWLWFINLFNFMDGIDGISGVEMASVSGGILALSVFVGNFSDPLSQYALVTAAAAIGFLWWNWHPAKIFLGDVGSIPIGFLLAYMLFLLAGEGYAVSALILPAYYLCDATITITRRLLRGEKIWEAHSGHFYQQAVRAGWRHDAVAKLIAGVNLLLGALAVLAALNAEIGWLYLSVAYGLVLAVLYFVLAAKHTHKGPT